MTGARDEAYAASADVSGGGGRDGGSRRKRANAHRCALVGSRRVGADHGGCRRSACTSIDAIGCVRQTTLEHARQHSHPNRRHVPRGASRGRPGVDVRHPRGAAPAPRPADRGCAASGAARATAPRQRRRPTDRRAVPDAATRVRGLPRSQRTEHRGGVHRPRRGRGRARSPAKLSWPERSRPMRSPVGPRSPAGRRVRTSSPDRSTPATARPVTGRSVSPSGTRPGRSSSPSCPRPRCAGSASSRRTARW